MQNAIAVRDISPSPPNDEQQVGHSYGPQEIYGNASVVNGNVYNYHLAEANPATEAQKRRTAVLDWLSPLTFRHIHEEIRERTVHQDTSVEAQRSGDYSGKWLLESDAFDQWRSRDIRKLWYHGMPGAGKTVLASTIIDHLQVSLRTLPKSGNHGKVAFLYLSYKEPHPLHHLLGSIIRQLVQDDQELPERLLEDYQRQQNRGGEPPTLRDLSILLADLSHQAPTYIVIDGLDECPRETRSRLVQLMQPKSFKALKLNLLITSRLLDEFEKLARGFERINIQADHRDIDLFIDREFEKDAYLQEFASQDPGLQDEVKIAVRKRCDGMFLLANIYLNLLSSQLTLSTIRQCLQDLPTDIDSTYDLAVQRILQQSAERKQLALEVFMWVRHSRGNLSLLELQHALAVDPKSQTFDPERIHQESRIRDVCGGLIITSKESVRFVHYTALTYFSSRTKLVELDNHASMAQTCINYLCTPVLEQPDDPERQVSFADDLYNDKHASVNTLQLHRMHTGERPPVSGERRTSAAPTASPPSRLNFTTKLEKYPFARFAARNLSHHLRHITDPESELQVLAMIRPLLASRAKRNFLCRLYWSMQLFYARPDQRIRDLHLYTARHVGDTKSIKGRADTDAPDADESSNTDEVATVEIPNEITPLHLAAYFGWIPLVDALMTDGSNVNAIDPDGRSPVIVAVQQGHQDVVAALLKHGAKVDLTQTEGQHVLIQAAQNGYLEVAKVMVSQPLQVPSLGPTTFDFNRFQYTPFLDIVLQTIMMILRWLGLLHPEVGEPWQKITSPGCPQDISERIETIEDIKLRLFAAACYDNSSTVEQILTSGTSDLPLQVALFLAVEMGHVSSTKAILDGGADIELADDRGDTVLHRAALRNDIEMVRLLLDRKPAVNQKNQRGQTAWWLLMETHGRQKFSERRQVLDALIKAGADPNMRDSQGVSVLYGAAAGGHAEIVRYLLEAGVDPSWQTNYGWAPLHWAAADGHLECVRLLIAAGASLNPLSDTSKTPLDLARTWKEIPNRAETVKLLVEAGALTAQEVLQARATRRSEKDPQVLIPRKNLLIERDSDDEVIDRGRLAAPSKSHRDLSSSGSDSDLEWHRVSRSTKKESAPSR